MVLNSLLYIYVPVMQTISHDRDQDGMKCVVYYQDQYHISS